MTDTCQRDDVIPSQCFQMKGRPWRWIVSLYPTQVFIYRENIANICVLHSDNSRATKCHEQTRMNRYPRQTASLQTARVAHFSPVVLKNRKRKAFKFSAQTRFVHDMWNSQLRALFVLHWILTPLKDAWYSKGKVFIIFHQNIWTFSDFIFQPLVK